MAHGVLGCGWYMNCCKGSWRGLRRRERVKKGVERKQTLYYHVATLLPNTLFLLIVIACVLVIEQENKLVQVLVYVLEIRKYTNHFKIICIERFANLPQNCQKKHSCF